MVDIKVVGFDLDGTLYKAQPERDRFICTTLAKRISPLYSAESVAGKISEIYSAHRSVTEYLVYQRGYSRAEAKSHIQAVLEQADDEYPLPEDPRLQSMLERLAQTRELFLLTNSGERSAATKLEMIGASPAIFSHAQYAASERRANGDAFRIAAGYFGESPCAMMYVGDRAEVDIVPAKRAGLTTVLVHSFSPEADYCIDEIYGLEDILNGQRVS